MEEVKLQETMDGKIWADEFMRLCDGKTIGKDFDHGDAIAWMCNAIMVGWDHAHYKFQKESQIPHTPKVTKE